ncbi:MAG: hypothetical protein AAB116_01975, partial [Candidatus Poribacteria bacterium]
DNVSGLTTWLSDAICRLSTGGGFSIRELYSNDEEAIFDVKRPLILNGIEDVGLRSDFADRTIIINLPAITGTTRLDEKALDKQFNQLHPSILGGLCNAVSMALKNIDTVKLDSLPRMADFALWITASEEALNCKNLVGLYLDNRKQQNELVLGASVVGSAIIDLMATRSTWAGTMKQLLDEIDNLVAKDKRGKSYPTDATRLAGKLRRDAPQLRQYGIEIVSKGHTKKGSLIEIVKSDN